MGAKDSVNSSSQSYIFVIFLVLLLIISAGGLTLGILNSLGNIYGNLHVRKNLEVDGKFNSKEVITNRLRIDKNNLTLDRQGNLITKGSVFMRGADDNKPGRVIKYQRHAELQDTVATDINLTVDDILTGYIVVTVGSSDQTLRLPSPSDFVSSIDGLNTGDAIEFTILKDPEDPITSGDLTVNSQTEDVDSIDIIGYDQLTGSLPSSGLFRIRFINVSKGDESYALYRVC